MKKSKTVFLTTIFPKIEPYIIDFLDSLEYQDDRDFDILIINDGFDYLEKYKNRYNNLNLIEKKVSKSPAENRQIGINLAKKMGYENLIFGDADDIFSENRIRLSKELLEENDLVVNDLTIFGINNKIESFFSNTIKDLPSNIFAGNIFGFSNTAIKSKLLKENIFFPNTLIAVDWYFFSILQLINSNIRIKFTNKTQTLYRQHVENMVGMTLKFDVDKILKSLYVKEIHFNELFNFCELNCIDKSIIFTIKNELHKINLLKNKLSDEKELKKYVNYINLNIKSNFFGWWSEII